MLQNQHNEVILEIVPFNLLAIVFLLIKKT